MFSRLKDGLAKTRQALSQAFSFIWKPGVAWTPESIDELKAHLLKADLGPKITEQLCQHLLKHKPNKDEKESTQLLTVLKDYFRSVLEPYAKKPNWDLQSPCVTLLIGTNGNGKTTSLGKLAYLLQNQGKKVLLVAGDTFRAAAIEQLQVWANKIDCPILMQKTGSDPAALAFDAFQSAKAKHLDTVLIDTAGRLHNKTGLMEELKKIKRVLQKLDPSAPHETILVLDACTGQNALQQAKAFHEAMGISGLCITKLDGTAKGGVLFSIVQSLQLPIYYIGVGEGLEDLKPFEVESFLSALLDVS